MIIDSHTHISCPEKETKNLSQVKSELLASMEKYGIDYSIVIPDNVPNPKCADMDILAQIIDGEKKLLMMGTVNIFQEIESQIKKLETLLANRKICAIKLFPGHDPFYPIDKRCFLVYELCKKYDLPVVIHTGENSGDKECAKYNDPKFLVEIADKNPQLKIIISHFFWPQMEYCWEVTKDFSNIYYDTSAMADPEVVEATGGWNKVLAVLKKAIENKPDNVLFGSDWPMCPIDQHLQLIKDLGLAKTVEEKIIAVNAQKVFKL